MMRPRLGQGLRGWASVNAETDLAADRATVSTVARLLACMATGNRELLEQVLSADFTYYRGPEPIEDIA
jgi:hypothetical protein